MAVKREWSVWKTYKNKVQFVQVAHRCQTEQTLPQIDVQVVSRA